MQAVKSRRAIRRSGIIYIDPEEILPNPIQPRQIFDDSSISELSESIKNYGILNPLTVRLRGERYELVAGERRLRAAKLAESESVPCVVLDVSMEDATLLALIENLQRKDLDFIEEAEGINRLIKLFGMSQEEAARRIGKSQSAVANKLRLLKLPKGVLEAIRDNGLTERHGRALLRLRTSEEQTDALNYIIDNDLTVSATDTYIDKLLTAPEKVGKDIPKKTFILKDVRVFLNTLSRSLDMMKQNGIDAGFKRVETDNELILTISIPKAKEESIAAPRNTANADAERKSV